MSLSPSLLRSLAAVGAEVRQDAPLARLTWWRVGGPADGLLTVKDAPALCAVLQAAHEHDTPVMVLGNGSNLLVSDRGVRGLVIKLAGALADTHAEGDTLRAGAGLRLNVLLARAIKHRWPGLEALAGIPGTIGGAVRMNAGTSLGEISDLLVTVTVALPDGTLDTLCASTLQLAYRTCVLPPCAIVTSATLRLSGDADLSHERIRDFLARRKATQPLDFPSCGSTFRNPPGDAAGRLIDAAGLKGTRVGGAIVSDKHANFLLNVEQATATDLKALIEQVRARVHAAHGVALEPEVKLAGVWDPPGWAPIS
jgi:UDP-N-acetylmuramate dehydrogenase